MVRSICFALTLLALLVSDLGAVEKGGRLTPPAVAGVLNHGSGKTVALTFDACPRPSLDNSYEPRIAVILRKEKVPATFFISGLWALRHPAVVKDLAGDALFEIGNHGHKHLHPTRSSTAENRRELTQSQAVLQRIAGKEPKIWRPPYGEVDTAAVSVALSLGLQTVNFSLASGDPDVNISAKRMAERVVENTRPGSIIVFHVNGNGPHTAEALPNIIAGLRKRGFTFVQAGAYVQPLGIAHAQPR